MTAPDDLSPDAGAQPRAWGRSAAIIALFALAGPLAGALGLNMLLTMLAGAGEIARGDMAAAARQLAGGMIAGSIFAVILGYAVGAPSALGVGIIVALRDRAGRGLSLRFTVLAALGLWAVSALVVVLSVPEEGRMVWIGALLAAHLVAGLTCGWLARRVFADRPPKQVME